MSDALHRFLQGLPGHARIPMAGTCNRCGLCCTVVGEDGKRLVCEHLVAEFPVKALGAPEASRCRVYEQRVDGMIVRMLDASGTARLVGPCGKDSAQEDHQILDSGIGNGCSLTVKVHQGQLAAFEPARR